MREAAFCGPILNVSARMERMCQNTKRSRLYETSFRLPIGISYCMRGSYLGVRTARIPDEAGAPQHAKTLPRVGAISERKVSFTNSITPRGGVGPAAALYGSGRDLGSHLIAPTWRPIARLFLGSLPASRRCCQLLAGATVTASSEKYNPALVRCSVQRAPRHGRCFRPAVAPRSIGRSE